MSVFRGTKPFPRATPASSGQAAAALKTPPASASPAVPRLSPHPPARLLPVAAPTIDQAFLAEESSALRRVGFFCVLLFVFFRFSLLHEMIALKLGFDTHLVVLVGLPTLFLTVAVGGLRRTLQGNRLAFYWLAFSLWLAAAIPTSFWISGSITSVAGYFKSQVPMLFLVAGMVLTWKELVQIFTAIGISAIINVAAASMFQRGDGRLALELGTIGNSNDYVAHLLFVLPFLVFVILTRRNIVLRVASLGVLAYGLYLAAGTGSRGGLLAFAAVCLMMLTRASMRQRLGFVIALIILVPATYVALPRSIIERYRTMFSDETTQQNREAVESKEARTYLFRRSVSFTLEHPIFGVGPGEFMDFEGDDAAQEGRNGAWHVTHNAYTQVSSEAGLPAFFFFITGIGSCFLMLNRVYREARKIPGLKMIANAAFCCQLSMVGFCTAIVFLSLSYSMYLLTMASIAIALERIFQRERARVLAATSTRVVRR